MGMRLRLGLAMVMAVAAMPQGWAYDWATVATISDTVGVNNGRLCVGLTRGDIGCPVNAPSLNANGDLTVYGNLNVSGSQIFQGVTFANGGVSATGAITATTFYGDGSGITGIDFSLNPLDRIISGTTNILANQNQSLTFTTAGSLAMVIGSNGEIQLGNSTTLNTQSGGFYALRSSLPIKAPDFYFSGSGGNIRNNVGSMLATFTNNMLGLGTTNPSTTLHVSGTLRIANGGETCDANRAGAIRYTGSDFQVCYGSGGWSSLLDASGTTVTPDRITSGTTNVITNGVGQSISFTVAGVTTGYFYNGKLVANGVSTTGAISGTDGYFSGNVGIGTTTPATALEVNGLVRVSGSKGFSLGGDANRNRIQFNDTPVYGWPFFSFLNSSNALTNIAAKGLSIGTTFGGISPTTSGAIIEGNVGIGTSTPWNELEINGSNSPRIALRSNSETVGEAQELGFQIGSGANASSNTVALIRATITQATPSPLKGSLSFLTNAGDSALERMTIMDSGNVGIGTINPSTTLDVFGTLKIANGGEACDTSRIGAIKYDTGAFYVCQSPANGWEALATTGANSLADRITSGTTQVITNGPGNSISFTVGGVTTGYFYNGQLVANAVSTTGPGKFNSVSVTTNGYFGGNVGINAAQPAEPLHIAGPVQTGDTSATNLLLFERPYNSGVAFGRVGSIALGSSGPTSNEAGRMELRLNPNTSSLGTNPTKAGADSVLSTVMTLLGTGNVGIGTTSPAKTLDVSGPIMVSATGTNAWPTEAGNVLLYAYSPSSPIPVLQYNISTNRLTVGNGGANYQTGLFLMGGNGDVTIGSTSVSNSLVSKRFSGYIGIQTTNPQTTLDVNGAIRISADTSATTNTCDTNRSGAIRYNGTNFQVCYGTGGWATLTDASSTVATADRITSGTAQVIANGNTNSISITESGITTAYYYNGIWVAGGVSTTGPISTTGLYVTGTTSLNGSTLLNGVQFAFNSAAGNFLIGRSNMGGNNNTVFGYGAFSSGSSGSANVAIGNYALQTNSIGANNTALGYGAGTYASGSRNVLIGRQAGLGFNGASNFNDAVVIGSYAGTSLTTGGFNTILGAAAARTLTTGASNIIIGANANPYSDTGSNQLSIANAIYGDIGSGTGNANKIGINVPSPTANLEVSGTISGTILTGKFVGDGSGLTGVIAAGSDRIISNTAQVIANGNSNSISITEAGVTTGYYYGGVWVSAGVSTTGAVSATSGYFNNKVIIDNSGQLNFTQPSTFTWGFKYGSNFQITHNSSVDHYVSLAGLSTGQAGLLVQGKTGLGMSSSSTPSATLHILGTTNVSSSGLAIGQTGNYTTIYPVGTLSTQYNVQTSGGTHNFGGGGATWVTIAATGTNVTGALTASTQVSSANVSASFIDATRGGTVSATNGYFTNISATHFYGDGSGLTGVIAAGSDRIISNTAQVIANGNSNSISITEAGVTTGYYYNGIWVAGGVSTTGPVSATNGYFSGKVGINTLTPKFPLDVYGNARFGTGTASSSSAQIYIDNLGSQDTYLNIAQEGIASMGLGSKSGDTNLYLTNTYSYAFGTPSTSVVLTRYGNMGIATNAPSTTLHVSGTLRIANGGEACDTNRLGAVRYTSSTFYICQNTTDGWQPLATSGGASGMPDRIVSGTSAAIIDPTGNVTMRGRLDIVTGTGVVAMGQWAGQTNTGTYLTSLGYAAAQNNTANYLAALGSFAGQYNTGSYLTAVGYSAAQSNTAPNVVAVGNRAAQNNYGNDVTAVGTMAAQNNTTSNTTAVGSGAAGNNTGVGLTAMGYAAGSVNTGNYSVVIGVDAGHYNTGGQLTAVGYDAGNHNSGTLVSAYGYYASYANTGNYATALGSYAGYNNTGDGLTAVGYVAAEYNTAPSVTAVGYSAALSNSGTAITAIGYQAAQTNTGNNITSLGFQAGRVNTGGNSTFLGYAAGQVNTGPYTTAIGHAAAQVNTGSNVTAVGYLSGISNTYNNVTLLGNGTYTADKNNQVVLGNSSVVEVSTSGVLYAKGISTTGSSFISGTLKIADGGEACDTNRLGALKYISGAFYICQNTSNGWEPIATTGASSLADRITSGTTQVITNSPGNSISFTVGGVTTGYFYNGQLVANAVSTTGAGNFNSISVTTNGYFGGNVGIGTMAPASSLDIQPAVSNSGIIVRRFNSSGQYLKLHEGDGTGHYIEAIGSGNKWLNLINRDTVGGGIALYASNTLGLAVYGSGNIGVKTSLLPSTTLDVAGTIRIADGGEACDANRLGALKYISGAFYICQNTASGWQTITTTSNTTNLSETIAINDLTDASSSMVVESLYMGNGAGLGATGTNNTVVGIKALNSSNTGNENTAFGSYALYTNGSGNDNVAMGYYALSSNDSGNNNIAIGTNALLSNVSGSYNVATGYQALFSNTSGYGNVAAGPAALYSNTSGYYNVATGQNALYSNNTGHENTAYGYLSLYSNTSGYQNVAVGTNALNANDTGIKNVAIGYQALQNNMAGSGNVGTGASALYYADQVTNTVAIGMNSGLGTAGQTSFANGTFLGYASGQAITTGNANTFLGYYAGATTTTGSSNTLIGALAYAPTAGTSNYLNIANAISGSTTTGGSMTFIGGIKANGIVTATYFEGDGSHLTGLATTNLSETIAINDLKDASASTALESLYMGNGAGGTSTASGNTGVGIGALFSDSTGNNNTAYGSGALYNTTTGSTNTANGVWALLNNDTGNGNTANGAYALFNSSAGNYNTANGTSSGQAVTTGNANTFLGYYAGGTTTTGSSNTLIGALAYAPTAGTNNWLNIANAISGSTTTGGSMTFIGGIKANGIVTATYFEGDGSRLTNLAAAFVADRIISGTAQVIANGSTNSISITEAGITTGYYYGGQWVAGSISTTGIGKFNSVSVTTNGYFGGLVGVGTQAPATALDVSGSLKISNGGETCGAGKYGTMRVINGVLSICRQ